MTDAKNAAFAAAYRALCERYPIQQKYDGVARRKEQARDAAFETALYSGDLSFTLLWSEGIPDKEIEAVHALIYG